MGSQGGQSDKRAAEEAAAVVRENAIKKAQLAQEEKTAERMNALRAKEKKARAAEEPGRLATEEARKKAYATREDKIAEDLKARTDR